MQQAKARRQGNGLTPVSVVTASFALLVGVLWFFGNAEQVYACSCAQPGSPSEELEKFAAVFAGKVVSVRHSSDPDAAFDSRLVSTTIGFEVSAVWKGTVYEDMDITTPPTGGSCGAPFQEGEEYIVYAYDSPYVEGGYSTSICSRTAFLDQAQEDIDELGVGNAPLSSTGGSASEEPGDETEDWARPLMLALVAPILAVAGIVVYALLGCR